MEMIIQTTTFDEALRKALDMGFQVASILGTSCYIEEMMESCEEETDINDTADWLIVGDVLCQVSDIWDGNADVYYLH